MKHLQNPYLPVAVLLLLLGFLGYKTFFDSRYSKIEKDILTLNYQQNIGLKNEYTELADRAWRGAKGHIKETYGLGKSDATKKLNAHLEKQSERLKNIYKETHEKYFEKPRVSLRELETIVVEGKEVETAKFPPKVQSSEIVTAFEVYIKKASALDSALANRYEGFVFEEGMTNAELEDFYFDTDEYLRAFHYSRFEAQLATMYYEDTKLLSRQYLLYPLDLKATDIKVMPYVHYDTKKKDNHYYISTMSVVPFDRETTRLVFPENVETKFDENGFIIIPKEFRTGMQKFAVRMKTMDNRDTIFTLKQDFGYLNNYYKDEK